VKEWESYGAHWILAFNRCVVGLFVAQTTLIGMLGVKEGNCSFFFFIPWVFNH